MQREVNILRSQLALYVEENDELEEKLERQERQLDKLKKQLKETSLEKNLLFTENRKLFEILRRGRSKGVERRAQDRAASLVAANCSPRSFLLSIGG
ncbi:UNVERIFIED_CONTAM: hypothetical protein K2H54_049157 [Gekko kuhli]